MLALFLSWISEYSAMNDAEIANICRRCRAYADADMPPTSETNKALKQIRAKAKALRLALADMPGVVRVNLPPDTQKMLKPHSFRISDDPLKQLLNETLAKQEPELLRLLRGIETALKGKPARVNKKRGQQPGHYSECVLRSLARHQPASEYKTMRAMIYALAGKFDLNPDNLYKLHLRKQ